MELLHIPASRVRRRSADGRDDPVEVVDAAVRRDAPIRPSMILKQLSAAIPELPKVRVDRIHQPADVLVRVRHVAFQIHGGVVPIRVLEDEIAVKGLCKFDLSALSQVVPAHELPIQLAALRKSGKNHCPIAAPEGGVNPLDCLNLRRRETVRRVAAPARKHGRIESADGGILDEPVLDSVRRIAGLEHRLVKHR